MADRHALRDATRIVAALFAEPGQLAGPKCSAESEPPFLDPARLLALAEETVGTYFTVADWGTRRFFDAIRSTLGDTEQPETPVTPPAGGEKAPESLAAKMHSLLDRAIGQNTSSSRRDLFAKILDQIVPDEARIIGALSDGSTSPLLNVYTRTRAGRAGEAVLENISLIGKTANLALPHLTPMYVSHLLALGLVESGPEDSMLKDEYEILAADLAVLQALKRAGRGPIPPRIEKHTLRLSGLGLELWVAVSEDGGQR